MLFLWLKALHLIAVICWFAALFYLPRLFVYHTMAEDEISRERFKVMERKLYRGIANPAMMASILLGIAMIFTPVGGALVSSGGWFHAKLLFVVLLVIYHVICKRHMIALAEDRSEKSHVYFRWFNEAPVVAMIAIVILVVVKPF
jgi:protoporphyrinogen IX oxidase